MKQESETTFPYEPPEVEMTEVRVEQGFAGSDTGGSTPEWTPDHGQWQ